MDPHPSTPSPHAQHVRRVRVLVLAGLLLAFLALLGILQGFNLRGLRVNPTSTWVLFLLSTLSFLAIVVLTTVLARQVLKLLAERRANVLGAAFHTRLVIGALALSLIPVACMFGFTYGLINRTLDKWFSQPVVAVGYDNRELAGLVANYIGANATHEAEAIAGNPDMAAAARAGDWDEARRVLASHALTLEGGYASVVDAGGRSLLEYTPPGTAPPRGTLYLIGAAPLAPAPGDLRKLVVEVGMPRPPEVNAAINRLAQDAADYDRLAQQRRKLKKIYVLLLLLLALTIMFAAIWMAQYLSRGLAEPVAALAAATQEISRGNLGYRVAVRAPDEFRALVRSFNRMAEELETNRAQIEASRRELESRRQYTEALLDNTPSAVVSLDADYRVTRVNRAVERLFGPGSAPGSERPAGRLPGQLPGRLEDWFDPASVGELRHLLRKAARWPSTTGQIEVAAAGRALTLAVTVATLPSHQGGAGPRRPAGYVVVLEDLTDLLRMQRTAAWREVAQRIAHEIKNPLTPIALSAQRILRRVQGGTPGAAAPGPPQADTLAVAAECAATIEREARSLQRLVDEFSAFARFPAAQPVAADLNAALEHALRAFDGRLEGIEVRTRFEPLPRLWFDPDGMKRVFMNLIDNAAEAMHESPYRQITLATHRLDGVVEAVVADTGRGVAPADKPRLFMPYYSTKARGTGLGLAIVARIVEECGGRLRVEDNKPVGARFIVELPVAEAAAPEC